MALPANAEVWNCSYTLSPPPPGHILTFAYTARYGHTPCNGGNLSQFQQSNADIWKVAGGTGIDGSLIAGYVQWAGDLPTLPALQNYLNTIGVRDPGSGKLLHPDYRPGPGDGYNPGGPGSVPLGHVGTPTPPAPPPGGTSGNGTGDTSAGSVTSVAGAEAWVERNWLPVGGAVLALLFFRGGRR